MDAHEFASSDNSIFVDDDGQALAKLPREIQLIKHVAGEQALYNPKHEFYRNAARKDVKWGEIGTAIGWTELQCKAKWKAFRDQYCRELKRSKSNPKASVKWKYFKYLEFLRPFALSRNYRPRYVPSNNANGTNLSNSSTGTDEHKKNLTAAIIASDYGLLQNIKMEPKTQQEEQQEFVDECAVLTSAINAAATEQNVKNETIVVIAAEQLQHLNNVLQQQQQQQQQQSQHQQQHTESWSFLTSTTNGANSLLTSTTHHQQHNQSQQQQQLTNNFSHNNNNNNDNNIMDAKHIDQASNSSADYALLHNAIADCVAAAEAEAEADISQLSHQTQLHVKTQQQQQQQEIYMFHAPQAPTVTTSSDEEDDDPIHKFLNIESYFEKELIAMVQSEDILYNSFHPNYRNAKRKLDVWADIARKMKKTVKQCRLKWKALRDQYIREHKRLRNRLNIETLPRWKHYDALNFLHNFIKHKSETEEKKIFQLLKNENINNDETLLKNQLKVETQQQQQQQQLQLHPALIGLSNALAEHQRQQQQQQQQQHHHQQQNQYHEDLKNNVTISTATTTTNGGATVTATTLINIDENQSNSADDYDAMDIDNYINGDGDTSDIVMHENAEVDVDDDDVDADADDVDDDDVDDDIIDNDDNDNDDENGKAVKNIPNFNPINRVGCGIDNAINGGQNDVDSDFRKLKDIVSRTNSPALLSISNSQQQLCQQTQNSQQHHQQEQQQQQQHLLHQQSHQQNHQDDDNEHLMQVVGLTCDDVVVLADTNAAQLGFVVSSSSGAPTSSTTTTNAMTVVTPTKTSLAMQRDFTEQLVKLTTQTIVSPTPTSTAITGETLPTLNTTNGNVYYNNSHNHNHNHNNNNNNNNNSNNNEITVAATAHDVGSVFSAIADCADFAASFDDCSTSTIATTSLSSSLTAAAVATTTATASSTPTTSNSCLTLSCGGILNPPIATTTSLTSSTAAATTTTTTNTNGSTTGILTYTNATDDDEIGVFFKAIAMKIRSVNMSPIEFTDLQIEVLRVINQSLRKN